MICVGIVEYYWMTNTRMMAMNPLHSSDKQSLITFGYLETMTTLVQNEELATR